MRASRLLTILLLLQTRGRVSARQLAESLEVSVRSVFRDVDQLSAAGIPVIAERGRNGGFMLREGWQSPLTGLTEGEAQALFLAGLPGPAAELGLGASLASAQLKVLAALPSGWQGDAERVGARFHLDPVDWFRSVAQPEILPAVAQAVWNERRLKIRYESWKRVSWHVVEPLGLVLKAGVWYLVAREDRKEAEPRTYRVAAISELKLVESRFTRPRRFDLAAYWAEATRRFEQGIYRAQATLRVSPAGFERLRMFSPVVAVAAEQSARTTDIEGWREVTVPIESVEHASREMLRLGAEGVVLDPPELRESLRLTAETMLAGYEGRAPTRRATGSSARRSR